MFLGKVMVLTSHIIAKLKLIVKRMLYSSFAVVSEYIANCLRDHTAETDIMNRIGEVLVDVSRKAMA